MRYGPVITSIVTIEYSRVLNGYSGRAYVSGDLTSAVALLGKQGQSKIISFLVGAGFACQLPCRLITPGFMLGIA